MIFEPYPAFHFRYWTTQTAKRLAAMLVNAIAQHEQRYGTIDAAAQPPAPETNTAIQN